MGDHLQAGKPSWYVASHPGQLSLAIPPWVGTRSTSQSWDVNRHTVRCTSPISIVWQCTLVSGWGLRNGDQRRSMGLMAGEGLHMFTVSCNDVGICSWKFCRMSTRHERIFSVRSSIAGWHRKRREARRMRTPPTKRELLPEYVKCWNAQKKLLTECLNCVIYLLILHVGCVFWGLYRIVSLPYSIVFAVYQSSVSQNAIYSGVCCIRIRGT